MEEFLFYWKRIKNREQSETYLSKKWYACHRIGAIPVLWWWQNESYKRTEKGRTMHIFKENLKMVWKYLGETKEEISERLNISREQVCRYETGKFKIPSWKACEELEQITDISSRRWKTDETIKEEKIKCFSSLK